MDDLKSKAIVAELEKIIALMEGEEAKRLTPEPSPVEFEEPSTPALEEEDEESPFKRR